MEARFSSIELKDSRVQEQDTVSVLIPFVAVGFFLVARNYFKFDNYVSSGFAYTCVPWFQKAGACLMGWWRTGYWGCIHIHKLRSAQLYSAVHAYVTQHALAKNQCASVNAVLKYDRAEGIRVVEFENEGSHAFGTEFELRTPSGMHCKVCVEYDSGAQVCVGKDRSMQHNSSITLWFQPRTKDTWKAIKEFLEVCVEAASKQLVDRLDVYTLQQTSTEWIPEWKFSHTRRLKVCEGGGADYYIQREECESIYIHAKEWFRSGFMCYHIQGKTGSGKSEFAAWLAGQLQVPLYILNLSCPGLDNSRLWSVCGYAGLGHSDPVVLLIDEFQEVFSQLQDGKNLAGGVSLTGFHEMISSASSRQNGVLLLCGLEDMPELDMATDRRIHKGVNLELFTRAQLCSMAAHVLKSKVSDLLWPDNLEEVSRYMCTLKVVEDLTSIDKMMEFIRRHLVTAKEKTHEREIEWKEFLNLLFADAEVNVDKEKGDGTGVIKRRR